MWWQPNKPVFEKSALIAILGGVAVIIFIAVFTFGLQNWSLWRHAHTLDRYVPRDARIYLHVDLSAGQMKRWNSDLARARWSAIVTTMDEKLKTFTTTSVNMSDLIDSVGSEMALAQRTVAGRTENTLLIKTKSAAKFELVLKQIIPSHLLPQEKNVWISDDVSKIFGLGTILIPNYVATPQYVYWTELGDGVFILSSTPKFITDAQKNGGKYRNSIGDAMAGYRTGEPFISGFIPPENIWPAVKIDEGFGDLSKSFDEAATEPVYIEANIQSKYVWGQIRNYSQRLFDRLSTSDADSVAMASRLNLPPQYRVAYLRLPLGKIFEQLSDSSNEAVPLLSWMTFVKQKLGADWVKEIAPIVDVPADFILGPLDVDKKSQPFLLALLPLTTDTLDTQQNNLEALFRRLAGQLYPREILTTLTDGTKVTELVPDPQTDAWHTWTGEGAMETFKVMDIPTGGQILLGQLDNQNIITNSTELLKAVARPKLVMDSNTSDCLKRIYGSELIIVPGDKLADQSSLVSRFDGLYLANGSANNRISLMFCLMLTPSSQ